MRGVQLLIVLFLITAQLSAQSNWKEFWKQSRPIKSWVLLHPFKTKKALKISLEVQRISDSIANTSLLDGDSSGGQVDAFRHAYWMASLRQEIGKSAAKSLGRAHERDNYLTFKKKRLENGEVPDETSKKMDLFNNKVGLKFTQKGSIHSKKGLIFKVINAIKKGDLKIIKKDSNGNFLTCSGKIIPRNEMSNSWKNKKCLVFSSFEK